jgi:hypothetical protein
VDEVRRAGFRENQIGFVSRGEDNEVPTAVDETSNTLAAEGAMAGALAGAGVGGLVGLGILAGVIPVVGPAIAAGTLGTILLNAAGGAAIASVAGALIGLGIPEEEASYYEGEIKAGRYLVTVHADGRYEEAWNILQRHGAYCREDKLDTVGEEPISADPMLVDEEGLRPLREADKITESPDHGNREVGHQAMDIPVRHADIVRKTPSGTASSSQGIKIPVPSQQVWSSTGSTLQSEPVPQKGQGGAPFAAAEAPKEAGNVAAPSNNPSATK